jgi:hypothetical protein
MAYTKKTAERILKNYSENNVELAPIRKSFYQSIIDGKLPQWYSKEFEKFKNYSDDVVLDKASLVKQNCMRKKAKASGNIIHGISITLQGMLKEGLIKDEKLIAQINYFTTRKWNYTKGNGTIGEYFTTSDEVKLINIMLDTVIEYLKTTYKLD